VAPQLKRDPLGGERPPHKDSFANSFDTVIARGAEPQCARANLGSLRPATPTARRGRHAAPRTGTKAPAAQTPLPAKSGGLGLRARAARSSFGAMLAV